MNKRVLPSGVLLFDNGKTDKKAFLELSEEECNNALLRVLDVSVRYASNDYDGVFSRASTLYLRRDGKRFVAGILCERQAISLSVRSRTNRKAWDQVLDGYFDEPYTYWGNGDTPYEAIAAAFTVALNAGAIRDPNTFRIDSFWVVADHEYVGLYGDVSV